MHVWCAHFVAENRVDDDWLASLDASERERAGRFRTPILRARYVRSHAMLRSVLARYLACDPRAIAYVAGTYGKPHVAGTDLAFNLSHAGDCVLVAVGGDRPVGVDVERSDRTVELAEIATARLSSAERVEFATFARHERVPAFLRGWTRKEAYLKALGLGLNGDLRSFDVPLADAPATRVLADRLRSGETERWQLRDVAVPQGYCAALCARGNDRSLVAFDWETGLAEEEDP